MTKSYETAEMSLQEYALWSIDMLHKEITERGVSDFMVTVDSSPDLFPHKPGGPSTVTYTVTVSIHHD